MSRIGLQQLSTSARNSPFTTEKAVFDSKNSVKSNVEPLKITKTLKKYQPVVPSPLLATSSTPNVFSDADNKENAETQTVERHNFSCQTDVSIAHLAPRLTPEDLCSEEPTGNYLRTLADQLQEELEEEKEKNLVLVEELCALDQKLQKMDDETELLREVLEDIEQESL